MDKRIWHIWWLIESLLKAGWFFGVLLYYYTYYMRGWYNPNSGCLLKSTKRLILLKKCKVFKRCHYSKVVFFLFSYSACFLLHLLIRLLFWQFGHLSEYGYFFHNVFILSMAYSFIMAIVLYFFLALIFFELLRRLFPKFSFFKDNQPHHHVDEEEKAKLKKK